MLRLALTPRWLVAALGVLVVVAVCVVAGRWQWERTQEILAAERASASMPVPMEQLVSSDSSQVPGESIGRRVTLGGTYDAAYQAIVPNRLHDGRAGVWVVTGLRLADGSVAAVLRGSLASADDPGAQVPPGPVDVGGVLQADESFYADAQAAGGQVAAIDHARLGQLWGADVLPGFVTLVEQDPATDQAPTPVDPAVQAGDVPLPLQNFFYALEWWVFAAFAIAVYVRWLWLESRRSSSAVAARRP